MTSDQSKGQPLRGGAAPAHEPRRRRGSGVGFAVRSRRGSACRRARVLMPWLEGLEDRTVLSTVTWVGSSGGDWGNAANWSPAGVPTSGDDVVIKPTSAQTITHSVDQTDSVLSLTTNSNATLNLTGGELDIGAGSSTFGGPITVGSGVSMAVGANATVQVSSGKTLIDNGMLSFDTGDAVSFPGSGFGGGQGQIAVFGTLKAVGTTFSSGGLSITVDSFGVINPTGCTFNTAIAVPYTDVTSLTDNVSFEQINIETGTLSSGELDLNAIGTNTTNLSYDFAAAFTVGPQGKLVVGAGVAVTISSGVTLTDNGTLSFSTGDTVSFPGSGFGGGQGQIEVVGVLDATGTTFTSGAQSITVDSGGLINPTGCTFNTAIAVPYVDVPALTDNVSFEQIEIEEGTLSGELDLNAIGTNTSGLSYAIAAGFTVASSGKLAVGVGVSVTILSGEMLTVDGTLTFATGDTVSFAGNGFGGGFGQIVVAGILDPAGTIFNGGGSITVNSGGVINPTGSTFNLTLAVPYANVPALAGGNNVSFDTIEIEAGTLSGELDLDWIGTHSTNLSYALAAGFTVASSGELAVGAGVPVTILSGETLTDSGTVSFASGDSVSFSGNGFGGGFGQIVVVGILEFAGTTINSSGSITVSSGGIIEGSGSRFGMSQLALSSGANATLHFNTFTGQLAINSGATVNIVGNNLSGVGKNGIIATGTPSAHIPLENNYWATSDPTAIGNLILDHNDNPTTRPYVDFQPVWVNASGTIATPLTVIYSASDQNITLSAAVETTGGIPITGGQETFTIFNSNNQQVGSTTLAENVVNGTVSATYDLPGGTAVGQYTIKAVFTGGGGVPAAPDTSQFLTITPLASQVAITSTALNQVAGTMGAVTVQLEDSNGNTGATSTSDQTINLSTTSSAGVFYVNQSGGNPITSIVISAGQSTATVYYADTTAGTPTVTASDPAFNSSSNQNETINPAAVSSFTVTTTYASPDTAGTAGTVTVTAYDSYGNVVGSGPNPFMGAVSLRSTDSKQSGLPPSYTFTSGDAGSHAFTNVILKTAGNQTFTATYVGHPTVTGTSSTVNVVPAPASVVAITSSPLTLTTGAIGAMTVQLEDAYGNTGATSTGDQTIKLTTTSSAGVFYASQSGGTPITSVSITAGNSAATVYYADTKAGTPTVTAADTAFNSSPTQKETIKVGDASQVVITSAPVSFTAGGRGGPITVQLEDSYGNTGATSTSDQTISLSTTSSVGAFYLASSGGSPITSVVISAGKSSTTFYYGDNAAGNPTITAADAALNSSSNQTETVKANVATQIAITSAPVSPVAGTKSGTITVSLEDANGNPGATSTTAQTVKLTTTSTAGVFYGSNGSATTSVTIPAGQTSATFTYSDTKAGAPKITAADTAFNSTSSQTETIDPAATDHLVVTTSFANPDVAGTAGTVTVTAYDTYGNIAGSGPDQYLGTVDLTSTDGRISGLPPTYAFAIADAGSHTFTSVVLGTVGSQTITATDSGISTITGTSPTINVAPGHAVSLAIVKRPPGGIPAGSRFTVAVGAVDPYGNTDPSFNGPVTVALAAGSDGTLGGTLIQTAVNGVATFDDLFDTTSGSITLTGTSGTLSTGSSGNNTVPIDPATTDHLTVTTSFATPDVAGTTGTVTVAAYDTYGNLESSGPNQYLGTVNLVSSDGQITGLPASYLFTPGDGGTHTFTNVALDTAGSQTITATDSADSAISGTSAAVQVIPAAASQLLIINAPLTLAAGNRGLVLLQFEDAYGNLGATTASQQTIALGTTSSAGAFYTSSSGGSPVTSITVASGRGSATFYYTDTKAGTPTVTPSDAAFGSGPSQQETINPAAASQIAITSSPLTLPAGNRGPIVVKLEDAYGNLGAVSASDQMVALATTSSAGAFYAGPFGGNPITSVSITAGLTSATVYYLDTQAGGPTVTVSDAPFSSSVNQIDTIESAAADHFVVTTSFPSPDVAGTAGAVTITAKDAYGNTADSGPYQYKGTIDLTGTDAQASGLPSSYGFTAGDAGSHTFLNVILKTAGNQTITAADSVTSTITGTSSAVDVVAAPASQVAVTSAPSALVAGDRGPITIQLEDLYGNPAVSTVAQTIGLSTTGTAGAFYAGPSGGATIASAAIPAGQSAVTAYYGDTQTGTPTITAADTALSSSPIQKETIVPAAADHFTVTSSFASPDVAGTAGSVTVTAYDPYNNRASSGPDLYEGTVDLSSSDGQIAGLPPAYTFTATDAGSHAFTNVILKTAGSQTIAATDSASSAITGHIPVAVTPAAATHLVFTTPPPNPITPGQAFTVVVSAEDPYGNVDPSFNGSVTITLPTQPATNVTGQAANGVATFANLTVDGTAQGGALQVGGGGLSGGSTGPVSVKGGSSNPGSGSSNPGGGSNSPGNGSVNTPAPTITGQQVVMFRKTNKKGKPVGKPVLQGFTLDFSTAMNAGSAGSAGNYRIAAVPTKHGKKKTAPVLTPVPFTASYDPVKHSVTLTLAGKQAFAKGGQITVSYSAVSSESGVGLDSSDAMFTIAPKGTGIALG